MKHYGPEPPWRTELAYGYWRWIPPLPNSWFEEPGYWQWYPPRATMEKIGEILKTHYMPRIREMLA